MRVLRAIAGLVMGASVGYGASSSRPTTTTAVYVGKHFELREHDAPVKYVFNGDTRVARVSGSLSANERIQRLRLRTGWNLVSLAVTAPGFLAQVREFTTGPAPVLKALYRWQPATKDYGTIASGESVAAGAVFWISAQTNVVVAVRGGYADPTEWRAPASGSFVAAPALEVQPLTVPAGVTVWRYDAQTGRWQLGATGDLASLNELPPALTPGEAIYVHSNEPVDLGTPAQEERIRYYHQDHLGSSSVMTDANGALVEETAFYPNGEARSEHRVRQSDEAYKFTQKERDQESGLHYFEARYLAGSLARFVTQDPKYANPDALKQADATKFLASPQELNLYAYARNNPLKYVDPMGLEVSVTTKEDRPGHKDTEIKFTGVLIDESSKKLTYEQLKSMQGRLVSQVQSDFTGSGDQQSWHMTVTLRIVKSASEIKSTDHVIRIKDALQDDPGEITLGMANKFGGKEIDIRASLADQRPRPDGRKSSLERVVSHEVGHTLGLRHIEDPSNTIRRDVLGRHNLMTTVDQAPRGTQINVHQIREIQKLSDEKKLNQ